MLRADPSGSLDSIFDCLRGYWMDNETGTLFQGCNCWNTVAGKGNFPITVERIEEYFRRPVKYGIKMILSRVQDAGLFSPDLEDVLDCCAINNLVRCSGKLDAGNPTPSMRACCLEFLEKEIHILRPEIVITFGKATIPRTMLDGIGDLRFSENLPHPALRPGPWNKQHPPGSGMSWSCDCERKQYKDCLALKGLVEDMVSRMTQAIA